MKRLIFVLFLFAGQLSRLTAETFERAEVVKAIKLVSLLPQATRAVPGDVVTGNTGVKTGNDSRAELQFPDLTITRVGANSLFRFVSGTREVILDRGTILFSAPAGTGGGKVHAGAITAAVTGSDFMISNVGRVKVICLSHKVTVYLTANPKIRAELRPGQVLDITPGMDRKMPRPTTINLGKLLTTSKLSEAGGFRPLPSQAILAQNTKRQAKAFSLANADLTSESAEEVRATTDFPNNTSSQSRQAATAQTARDTEEATSASSTGNNGNPGNSGNNGNPGNSGNNVNRGNRGNSGNPGNSGNNGNPGNSGNNGNPGNSGNNGNPGNSGNNGNRGNPGNSRNK